MPRTPRSTRTLLAVGGALVLVGVVAGAMWVMRLTFLIVDDTAVRLVADGDTYVVPVPAGKDRMIFHLDRTAPPTCAVTTPSGATVEVREQRTKVTTENAEGRWRAFGRFHADGPEVRMACTSASVVPVQVGPPRGFTDVFGPWGLAVAVPLLAGAAGVVILGVVGLPLMSRPPGLTGPDGP